jgi:hypothetical protein
MDIDKKTIPAYAGSRRRFVWGLGIFSAIAAVAATTGLPFLTKKSAKTSGKRTTVKMLTEDGKLVEVDASLLSAKTKKITNGELQHWIKK